jgi:hypothetical protein
MPVPLLASVKVTVGLEPVQSVLSDVAWPVPTSVTGLYVGLRFDGPLLVTEHEAEIVVETLNEPVGEAAAQRGTDAKRATPAANARTLRMQEVEITLAVSEDRARAVE